MSRSKRHILLTGKCPVMCLLVVFTWLLVIFILFLNVWRFNVLLDRCYTTTSSSPNGATYYDLFAGWVQSPKWLLTADELMICYNWQEKCGLVLPTMFVRSLLPPSVYSLVFPCTDLTGVPGRKPAQTRAKAPVRWNESGGLLAMITKSSHVHIFGLWEEIGAATQTWGK